MIPFGLVNTPTLFIIFVYDIHEHWNVVAEEVGVIISDNTNTKIIIDDIFVHVTKYEEGILYLRAILKISKLYNIT